MKRARNGIIGAVGAAKAIGGPTHDAKKAKAAKKPKNMSQRAGVPMPLEKYVISAWYKATGPHSGGVHGGLDFGAKTGERIGSINAGTVTASGSMGAPQARQS